MPATRGRSRKRETGPTMTRLRVMRREAALAQSRNAFHNRGAGASTLRLSQSRLLAGRHEIAWPRGDIAAAVYLDLQLVLAGSFHAARRVAEKISRAHFLERFREQLAQLTIRGGRPGASTGVGRQTIEEIVGLDAHHVDDDADAAGGVEDGILG